jgi:hypothetical protein
MLDVRLRLNYASSIGADMVDWYYKHGLAKVVYRFDESHLVITLPTDELATAFRLRFA